MNDEGQVGLGAELSKNLFFFPEFIKRDLFIHLNLKVIDVSIGLHHTMILCKDPHEPNKTRVFGLGGSAFG